MSLSIKDAMLNQLQQNQQLQLVNFRLLQTLKDSFSYFDQIVNHNNTLFEFITENIQQVRDYLLQSKEKPHETVVAKIFLKIGALEIMAKQKNQCIDDLLVKMGTLKSAKCLKNIDRYITPDTFQNLTRKQRQSLIQQQQLSILAQQYKQLKLDMETVCKDNENIHQINDQIKNQNKHLRIMVDNLRKTLIQNTGYIEQKKSEQNSLHSFIQKRSLDNYVLANNRACSSFELPSVRQFQITNINLHSKPQLKQSSQFKQTIYLQSNKNQFGSSRLKQYFTKSPCITYQEKEYELFQTPKPNEKCFSIYRQSSRSANSNRKFLKELEKEQEKDSAFLKMLQEQIVNNQIQTYQSKLHKSPNSKINIRQSQNIEPKQLSKQKAIGRQLSMQNQLRCPAYMVKTKFCLKQFQSKIMHQGYGSVSSYFR